MMSSIMNIIHKELLDAFRDQRSMLASLAFAIAGPLLIYVTLDSMAEEVDRNVPLEVTVSGAEYAPALVSYLKQQGLDLIEGSAPSGSQYAGESGGKLFLGISSAYPARYEAGQPSSVDITADFRSEQLQANAQKLKATVAAFGAKVMQNRMLAQGISPSQLSPININVFDSSRSGGLSARYAGMLGFLFLTASFISGAFVIADTIAGERERHSLLPLVSQPVSPLSLIIGKWAVAALVAAIVSTLTVAFSGYLLSVSPMDVVGIRFWVDPMTLALIAICLLPLAGFAAALQLFIVARSKTYREAATYVQYTIFLPIILAAMTQVGKFDLGTAAKYLPITGHDEAMQSLLLDGQITLLPAALCAVISFAATMVLLWQTSRAICAEETLG